MGIKLVLCSALFSSSVFAALCEIKEKKSGNVVYTYKEACSQGKFGGPWGDAAQFTHALNPTREAAEQAAAVERGQNDGARRLRLQAIKAKLKSTDKLTVDELKDILNEIVDRLGDE